MNSLQSLYFMLLHLSLLIVPLLAAAWCLCALWRRRRQAADFTACSPLGSPTSRVVETIAIAAGCVLLIAFAATQLNWRELLFADVNDPQSLRYWGAAAIAFAVIGLVAALIFAWRGMAPWPLSP